MKAHRNMRRIHVSYLVGGWFVRSLKRLEVDDLRSLQIGLEAFEIADNIQASKLLALRSEIIKRNKRGSYEH